MHAYTALQKKDGISCLSFNGFSTVFFFTFCFSLAQAQISNNVYKRPHRIMFQVENE